MPDLLNRALYHLRSWAWDVSNEVEWLDQDQPYYEREDTVDAYDSVAWAKGEVGNLSTMRSPTSGALIELVRQKGCRSVLDIGCGAGAFYHLLSTTLPEVRYQGVDISSAQIKRARKNFGDRFEVRDVSSLKVTDFAGFDAVHVYSVFVFMSIAKQLSTVDRILSSGAWTIIEIGTTIPDVRYAPRCAFKNTGHVKIDGMKLLTAVAWPYQSDVLRLVARYADRYEVTWKETTVNAPKLLNRSRRDGGALAVQQRNNNWRQQLACHVLPTPKRVLVVNGTIKPKGWMLPATVPQVEVLKET